MSLAVQFAHKESTVNLDETHDLALSQGVAMNKVYAHTRDQICAQLGKVYAQTINQICAQIGVWVQSKVNWNVYAPTCARIDESIIREQIRNPL